MFLSNVCFFELYSTLFLDFIFKRIYKKEFMISHNKLIIIKKYDILRNKNNKKSKSINIVLL